jgi:beta propeller repeat protein
MNTLTPTFLFILILTLPGVLVVPVAEQDDFPLTLAPLSQVNPAIYGDIVVWQDNRNGNWGIYGYNLSTKEEFQITTDDHDQYFPAIYSNIVVWVDSGDESTARTLYCYDLLTGEKTLIPTTATVDSAPAIYGDTVVWEGHLEDKRDIITYNLSTDEEFLIPLSSFLYGDPAISGDIVIWSEEKRGRVSIQGFNLQERKKISIPSTLITFSFDEDQMNPRIYNEIIVWTEGNVIHALNLETRKETLIAEMETCYYSFDEENLAVYKDVVVWRDCRTGCENILGYNLSTKKGFQITSQGSGKGLPAVYGDMVVWQDSRNGDWDIYGFDLTSPVIPLEMSRNDFVLSDLFEIGIILGPLAFLLFFAGRLVVDMKNFEKATGSELSQEKKFRRNPQSGGWITFLFNHECFQLRESISFQHSSKKQIVYVFPHCGNPILVI